ncbi:MAG TPA: lysophospholipid acyltransferase family protein [bacterium]|nr:lysophospholipid acyltransferase family protein [bacterium]
MLYLLYSFASFLAVHLPLPVAYFIARRVADWRYYFLPELRRQVTSNLRVVLKQRQQLTGVPADAASLRFTVRQVYYYFARYLTDFLRSPRWTLQTVKRMVKVENLDYLREALSRQRGVVALTAHWGNWELAGIVASLLGFKVAAIAFPYRSPSVARLFIRRRQFQGVRVISTGGNPKQLLRAIRNNEVIAVLGDRLFGEKGILVEFMGQPTLLPRGPATLAVRTGAVMLPGFLMMEGDHYRFFFGPPFEVPADLNEEEKISHLAQTGARFIEKTILSCPEQWLNFTRMWSPEAE